MYEAVFTHAPSKSGLSGRGWSDSTNSPQICQLQVTGFRRAVGLVVLIQDGGRCPARDIRPRPSMRTSGRREG